MLEALFNLRLQRIGRDVAGTDNVTEVDFTAAFQTHAAADRFRRN